ncbi:MAG: M23 family metallopeptidase [Lachnospiraceae bacterium]|nr:M23 family metallopeptidase [Lachnospiraceae bacterium]
MEEEIKKDDTVTTTEETAVKEDTAPAADAPANNDVEVDIISGDKAVNTEKKKRRKYAVMLAKEHEDGRITTHHIGPALVEFISVVLGIVFLIFVCLLIYDSIVIKDLRTQLVNQIVENNELTDQNEFLLVENDTLSSKVAVLSETVTKKAANESAIVAEETENAIPKSFPLSGGTSNMEEGGVDSNDHPILKFTVTTGINIVSTGTGTVVSVEDDIDYGNRIIIDHENGYKSIYRNNGKVLVKAGDSIGKGYILFSIDKENTDFGYQIMKDDEYINPMDVIQIDG